MNPAEVSEGVGVPGTAVTVTAMLNAAARTTATEVTVSVAAGTASADDFTAVTDFTLTIEALATSGTADFTLIPVDDDVAEGNETVTVSGTTAASGLTVATPGATVTITDNDAASSSIALSVNPAEVSEGVGVPGAAVTVTAMLNAAARTTATEVTVSVAAGTASADDFAAVTDFTLTIEALATSGTADFTLIPVDDEVAEGNETVTVSGTTTVTGLAVAAPVPTVTITDNDTVTASFATTAATATEGGTASFTVTLSGEAANDVVLGWTTGGAGDTAASGDDYTAVTAGALTFLPEGALTQTITVTTLQDTLAEAAETFTLTLTELVLPDGVTLGTATATGTITDDDTLTAAVTGAATVAEGSTATFTVTLTGGTSTADVVVTYTVTGTATAGTDYTAPGGTLAIPTGNASGTIEIQTAADDVLDASETLVVTLTGASTAKGTAEVNAAAATTAITDVGSLTVSKSALRVTEGDTTGEGYTVVLDSRPTATVTVTVSGASGTDLTVSPASLTFTTGSWNQPQTVTVTAAEDEDAVADGAVTLTHTAQGGGYGGVTGDGVTVTIAEDDIVIPSNLVSVTADAPHGFFEYKREPYYPVQVPEPMDYGVPMPYVYEGEEATFTVTLSGGAATAAVEVSYTVGGEVTPGRRGDYTAPSGTLTIPRGSASGTIRIRTFLDVDGLVEYPERIEVTLTGATSTSGAVGVDSAGASATLLLWEGKERWVFVAESTVTEYPTAEWVTFNVSIGNGGHLPVDLEVHWRTRDGTARAGEDYVASTGTVILPAGTASRDDGQVRLLDDDIAEDTETFKVELTGTNFPERVVEFPEGGWDSADLTILDYDKPGAGAQGATSDDGAPSVTVTSAATAPVSGEFAVTVTFSEPVSGLRMSELVITNGRATRMASLSDGTGYATEHEVYVAPDPGASGEVTVMVPAGVATDADGAPNTASAPFTIGVAGSEARAAAVAGVAVTSSPAGGGAYAAGEEIEVTVRFDAPVTVDTGGGRPALGVSVGGQARRAGYGGGTGTAALAFVYTVTAGDDGDAGAVRVLSDSLSLNGGTIRDGAGRDADLAFRMAPAVTGVSVAPAPGGDGTWGEGEAVAVTVAFSETVTVGTEGGSPTIGLALGDAARAATYASGSGTRALRFTYVTAAADGDIRAVRVVASSLSLNGGRVRGVSGLDARLAHGAASREAPPAADAGPALIVADARAREGVDETIGFTVRVSPASGETVTVDYETADGTAMAGEDYWGVAGTLVFRPGDTERTVLVDVLDDAKDEGEETFTLRLSNATGARLADAEATGTIVNHDPLPKAWLARFGRTVAGQVMDAVSERLRGSSGSHVTLGGQRADWSAFGEEPGAALPRWAGPTWDEWDRRADGSGFRSMTIRELLLGSSFHLSSDGTEGAQGAEGARWAAWGRVAASGFDGKEGDLSLDGDVTTGLVGVDGEWDRWLAGVLLSHGEGEGTYTHATAAEGDTGGMKGELESTLTSVHPYVRHELNERVAVWGLLGHGQGALTLTEEGRSPIETDLEMRMGALGVRGTLLSASQTHGIDLAVRSDAFWMRMESDEVENLKSAEANASRLRLVLEGSRAFELGPSARSADAVAGVWASPRRR